MKLFAGLISVGLVASGIVSGSPAYSAEIRHIIEKIEIPESIDYEFAVSEFGPEFTNKVSPESIEVLEHFGPEAPAILNRYAIALEDALIEVVKENEQLKKGGNLRITY